MANAKLGVHISSCSDCEKYNKAIDILKMFDWSEPFKAIGFDEETKEILLVEEQVMRIIQMITPLQEPRKIRLVSQDELYPWIRK